MKKSINYIIATVVIIGLLAFGVFNDNKNKVDLMDTVSNESFSIIDESESNIFLDYGPRYYSLTKSKMESMTSFDDIIGQEHAGRIVEYKTISVSLLDDNEKTVTRIEGSGGDFNQAQLDFLHNADYSTNILVWAHYIEKKPETLSIEDSSWTPYITVIPETQAEYADGKDAMIDFLKSDPNGAMGNEDGLGRGRLIFTVGLDGSISEFKLSTSCGIPEIDDNLLKRFESLPGKWEPARNAEDKAVEQTLVLSYGMNGC